jgi:hypothetical protein
VPISSCLWQRTVMHYRLRVLTNLLQVSNYVLKLVLREYLLNKMHTFSTQWIFILCLWTFCVKKLSFSPSGSLPKYLTFFIQYNHNLRILRPNIMKCNLFIYRKLLFISHKKIVC